MKNEEGDLKYHQGPDSKWSIEFGWPQAAFHDNNKLENSESLMSMTEQRILVINFTLKYVLLEVMQVTDFNIYLHTSSIKTLYGTSILIRKKNFD